MEQRTRSIAVRLLPTPDRTVKMNLESHTYRWAITLLLCFALFHGVWGRCPSPPKISNTAPVKETSGAPGDTVVHTCDRNTGYYEIPGKSTTITCQDDGTWTTLEEFCTRACGVPPRLDYAVPSDEALNQNIFLPGTNVIYNCRPGYIRIPGSRSLTCQEDYTWPTPPAPFCSRRSCGNPGDIENGEMHAEDFLFGSRVTYTCNEGYRMISRRAYRDCQTDGTWSNAPPECEGVICQAPAITSDLTIEPQKDEYNYLDTVAFSCRKPLEVVGNKSATCTTDGTWNSDVPTCRAVNCVNPDVANSIRQSGFVGPYKLNSAISFECIKDFVLKGSSTITCNIDSEWVPGIPKCEKVSCGNPGILQNGHIYYENDSLGAKATYTCDKGYVLVPSVKYRICEPNAMWSGSAPSCEAICEEPMTPRFASRVAQSPEFYFNGAVVHFSCRRGFERVTDKDNTITCQGHSWSEPEEFCRRISCGDPGKIQNGHVSVSDYLFGSKAVHNCEKGYERNTTVEFRECQADGKWSGAISCIETKSEGLSVGAIIGIVIAVVAVLFIFLACICCKKKQKRGKLEPKVEYSHCSA